VGWCGVVWCDWLQVRTVHHKYLHPKEVLITDGVLNREINNAVGKVPNRPRACKYYTLWVQTIKRKKELKET
jgi:hypothetical protein